MTRNRGAQQKHVELKTSRDNVNIVANSRVTFGISGNAENADNS
jgi:hypothetical protein